MKECCGNCKHNKRDFSKPQNQGYIEFCCGNEQSDEYGVPTFSMILVIAWKKKCFQQKYIMKISTDNK